MEHLDAVRALAALAQDSRLAIFRRLVEAGPSGLVAGEIAKAAGMGATVLSFHIKELERAGLVTASRQGRYIRYALHVEGVRQLLTFLVDDCCGGYPELCGAAFEKVSRLCTDKETCHE
jgi:ArsR family transcriptional regulator, arsenate/arsenite/antimonite-responsive transcriptional repressor